MKVISNEVNDDNKLLANIDSPAAEGTYLNEEFELKKQ